MANIICQNPRILNVYVHVLSRSVVSNSLRSFGVQPAQLFCPWDFSGKDTGVGSHFLLQGLFLTQGSNLNPQLLCPLHYRQIFYCDPLQYTWASLVTQLVKNLPSIKETLGLIPRLGRSPGEGKGHSLQYLDLENSMDSIVYGITKSWTQLSDFHFSSLLQSHQRSPNHIYLLFKVLMP